MIHVDQIFGYSIVVLAAAPLASQLAIADIRWVFFFPLYAIPAISLMMIVGHLSKSAPVQTFRKLAPISAGIGWALTWHVAERLYSESLRGSQNLLYMLFSIRPTLTWAVSCGHSYNSEYCHDLNDKMNISVTQDGNHHYPDNFWPAQEFNKFLIRHNPIPTSMPPKWRANTWYLGHPEEEFDWAIPSVPLVASHAATWLLIVYILSKHYDRLGDILFKVFITVPAVLYMTVLIGLTGLGFHFRAGTILAEYTGDLMINKDATDFWADITGTFRTSILIVDYASAFTGFVLLATSRLRSGVNGLSALILVPLLMLVPTMQTILRLGCEGHLADVQPFYKIYASTDETISFDLLPVCFASSHFGSVFSALYFAAQYLYTSLGPMLVYVTFIYQAFIDDFPMVQNSPKKCVGMIALAFFIPSIFLYMPLGTRIAAFFRYTSQTCFVEVAIFVLIFFFYGWQRLEQDVLMTSQSPARPSLVEYFTRPTSPIFTFLQFTIVPMLLFAKFVAVFDYIRMGGDVNVHVDSGVGFLPLPFYVRRFIGYMITFAPVMIMGLGAALQLFQLVHKHGLPWSDTIKPSPEWMAHASVNSNKPRVHSLAYGIYRKFVFKHISYKTAMFTLFIVETFNGIVLVVLFFLNTAATIDFNRTNRRTANEYRSLMLLIFSSLHTYALYQMRQGMQYAQINGEKLSLYIGVATMEMAMLNAYMWLYGENHRWGTDWPPIIVALGITCLRGFFIMLAIAIRAHSIEHSRPSNTREASEVDPEDLARESADEGAENDGDEEEDDSPVIFDLAV